MGPYCSFCDRRCFVERELPSGRRLLMATCKAGMEWDRQHTGGYDHTTATNPLAHRSGAS